MKRDKKMDYSEIKTLKELQLVRKQLAAEIKSKEKDVVNGFGRLKLLLSPVYWVQRAFRSWQTLSRTWSFLMRVYQTIQNFLARQKATRADQRKEEEAAEQPAQTETKLALLPEEE